MDDPVERQNSMQRLFVLQAQVNNGQNLEEIEKLTDDSPYKDDDPGKALKTAKAEASNKQSMNETQLELAKVIELRKKQQEELEQAKQQIQQIKERSANTVRDGKPQVEEDETEYEYEYDSETQGNNYESSANQLPSFEELKKGSAAAVATAPIKLFAEKDVSSKLSANTKLSADAQFVESNVVSVSATTTQPAQIVTYGAPVSNSQ